MKAFQLLDEWYFAHPHHESDNPVVVKAFEKLYLGFEYAKAIIDGEKVACKQIIQACQRMFDDFEREDYNQDIRFNFDEAFKVVFFYQFSDMIVVVIMIHVEVVKFCKPSVDITYF